MNAQELYNLCMECGRAYLWCCQKVLGNSHSCIPLSIENSSSNSTSTYCIHDFIIEHDSTNIEQYLQEDATDNLPGFRQDQEVYFGCITTSEKTTTTAGIMQKAQETELQQKCGIVTNRCLWSEQGKQWT